MVIRTSDIATFYQCRRKFLFNQGERPAFVGQAASVGTMVHAGCHAFLTGLPIEESVRGAALPETEEESIILAIDVANFYIQNTLEPDMGTTIKEILATETNSPIELNGNTINAHCDLVYRSNNGLIVVRDYKTKSAIPSDYSFFDLDLQIKVYYLAIRKMFPGEMVAVEHDIIRREVPPGFGHRSLLTKSGRKSTASTDPADYFKRVWFLKNSETLDAWERDVEERLVEIENEKLYKTSPSNLCNSCFFLHECIAKQDNPGVLEKLKV